MTLSSNGLSPGLRNKTVYGCLHTMTAFDMLSRYMLNSDEEAAIDRFKFDLCIIGGKSTISLLRGISWALGLQKSAGWAVTMNCGCSKNIWAGAGSKDLTDEIRLSENLIDQRNPRRNPT